MNDHQQYVEEYRQLREQVREINNHLLDMLSRKTIKQARRKLDLHRISLDEEAVETAHVVMVDFALHFARKGGRTLHEVYFEKHPPAPGSVLDRYRQNLDTYHYTILKAQDIEPGVGIEAHDLLQDASFFLMDRNFSRTVDLGAGMASGVIHLPDYALTTGAALPLPAAARERLAEEIPAQIGHPDELDFAELPPRTMAKLAALIIRHALREGAASHVAYR